MNKYSLRFGLLAGIAAGLTLQPLIPLRADDHGQHHGGSGGADDAGGHDNGGADDGANHDPGDDHAGGDGQLPHDDHGKTEFLGTIQALPATIDLTGAWTVDGRAVTVDAETQIRMEHGAPAVGGKVEVEGIIQPDGSVLAIRVKTEDASREFEDNVFFGVIQALPADGIFGTWQVSGLTVLVSDTTRVETEDGAAVVGALVRIEGVQQRDASIVASEINIQGVAAAASQAANQVKVNGTIQQLPATLGKNGNWLIDGVVVTVTDDSAHVEGGRRPKVGRKVVIKGAQQINGTVLAAKVRIPK